MDMTAFRLAPVRPELAGDLPAVFHPRRFSDPVSDLNASVHDRARLLASAVEMIDHLGIEIISVEAARSRNSRVHVVYSRACNALEGAEVKYDAEWSYWTAHRQGVEIVWCVPVQVAA